MKLYILLLISRLFEPTIGPDSSGRTDDPPDTIGVLCLKI